MIPTKTHIHFLSVCYQISEAERPELKLNKGPYNNLKVKDLASSWEMIFSSILRAFL
jgi:hypothetical protein